MYCAIVFLYKFKEIIDISKCVKVINEMQKHIHGLSFKFLQNDKQNYDQKFKNETKDLNNELHYFVTTLQKYLVFLFTNTNTLMQCKMLKNLEPNFFSLVISTSKMRQFIKLKSKRKKNKE